MLEESTKLEQMVHRSITQVFDQHRKLMEKSPALLQTQVTSINTLVRYNTAAGLHVHSGAKITIRLHGEVSERDGDAPVGYRKADVKVNSQF